MAFDLSSISRTKRLTAPKMLLAGEPKIGKSTFAASAPGAIGVLTEDGMSGIDARAFPIAKSLEDVYAALETLRTQEHDFSTVFIDSLDWLEPLLHEYVCKAHGWADIEKPGYGKGYIAAAAEWRVLLDKLEVLRRDHGMAVVLICHVKQQRIEDPTTEGYDAWVLKLNNRASAIVEEWADIVGFAAHKVMVVATDGGFGSKENKARKTNQRVLHLEAHPAYPSGNRFGLKDCPLDWPTFMDALQTAQG